MTQALLKDIRNCETKDPSKLGQGRSGGANGKSSKQGGGSGNGAQGRARSMSYAPGIQNPNNLGRVHDPRLSDSAMLPRDMMTLSPDHFGSVSRSTHTHAHGGKAGVDSPAYHDFLAQYELNHSGHCSDHNAVFMDPQDFSIPWLTSPSSMHMQVQ
eukprot:UC1_evm1s397